MSETFEISLNNLNSWLEQETNPLVEPIRTDTKKLLEDIQSRLEDLKESCDKLLEDAEKEMDKRNRKTYRRAKFLYKLAENFVDLISEITIPDEISEKNLNQVSEQIKKIFKTIDQERTKWFRVISPYFILTRRRFDVTLKRVDDSYQNFVNFLKEDYEKVGKAENVSAKIDELRKYLLELEKYENGKEARVQKKEILEKKITKSNQKIEDIQSSNEVVELEETNLKIEELTKIVKRELRHVQKPLLKFQTLVNNPGYNLFPEANLKLVEYLEDPFQALATEKESYPLLKSILQKIDDALENKKMKLKSSRFRKAKDQINHIVQKSGLEKLRKESSIIYQKKLELVNSGTISEIKDEKSELNGNLNDLKREMELLKARDLRVEKQHKGMQKKVFEQKTTLENIILELTNKKVNIQFD